MSNREEFEEWFENDAFPLEHSNWFRRDEHGDYELANVQTAWQGWQAAKASEAGSDDWAVEVDERIPELSERLRATDSKKQYLSLSEQHEICDLLDALPIGKLYVRPSTSPGALVQQEDVRQAVAIAIEVMSRHGDGVVSLGAMTVLQDWLSSTPQPAEHSKAARIGKRVGVLVQNGKGEVAAVTDLGRVTWLPGSAMGPQPTQQERTCRWSPAGFSGWVTECGMDDRASPDHGVDNYCCNCGGKIVEGE